MSRKRHSWFAGRSAKRPAAAVSAQGAHFGDLCLERAKVMAELRRLKPGLAPRDAERGQGLHLRRTALEDQMLAIMQSNIRL